MEKNLVKTIRKENKVSFQIFFDSPLDLVFEVWASPEHLGQWWGPDGFTISTTDFDFSNGGIWNFIMHGPDGTDYSNQIEFTDISFQKHIFYKHRGTGETNSGIHFETKVFFEEQENGTLLKTEMEFPTKETLDLVADKFGAIEGGQQHLKNLGKYIESIIRREV